MFNSVSANHYSKYTSGVQAEGDIVTDATQASCLRNREFIREVLFNYLIGTETIFEVGTGTADQAIYFSHHFPKVSWQTSDQSVYHAKIMETVAKAVQNKETIQGNIKDPVEFDIDEDEIPGTYDVIYSSNVVHCIPWVSTENLFKKAATALKVDGLFILYGPYNIYDDSHIDGKYTSLGNKNFDIKLKSQDPSLGIRELSEIQTLAERNGFSFQAKHLHQAANNYVLIFKKSAA